MILLPTLRINRLQQNMTDPLTKHFISEANSLVEMGKVEGLMELADVLKWDRSSMSSAKAGRRPVPLAVYKRFTEMYNITPYSETSRATGDPITDKYIQRLEKDIALLEQEVILLKDELREVALANQVVGMTNQDLLIELVSRLRKQDRKKVLGEVGIKNGSLYDRALSEGNLLEAGK